MALRSVKKKVLAAACPSIKLQTELGSGGNARVFAATSVTHGSVAVKFLLNENTKRYHRFRDEVLVVTTRLLGSRRVIPIFQHHLPDPLRTDDYPWYVMPSARRLRDSLMGRPWKSRLQALIELADGLSELHALEVAHRDIKPDNLFELDGSYRFGDFGIAAFPENAGVTSVNEPMGPAGYMAPEMLKTPTTADPYMADVYSLAKTVWAVLSEERFAFGGHYDASTAVGLSNYIGAKDLVIEPVDTLLEDSTRVTPAERPTAKEFSTRLKDALEVQDDFRRANVLQWEAAELQALRGPGLARAVWEGAPEIARVITLLSRRDGLNHCFFPSGGGLTVEEATACEGNEMLALRTQLTGMTIVKPTRLTLERFLNRPDFSYAVLETADVEPLGVKKRFVDDESERLKQVSGFDYVQDDSEDEEPRNRGVGIPCQRFFKGGVFVIAPTTGIFNRVDEYQGTAMKLGRDMLRARFEHYFAQRQEHVDVEAWEPVRIVRLLWDADAATFDFNLEHIDQRLLRRLVEVDDALVEARKRDNSGPFITGVTRMKELLSRKPGREESAALELLRGMGKEQRGEYLALVQIARGDCAASELAARTAANTRSHSNDQYLYEKFGNGYMRKALARFGLVAPATRLEQSIPGPFGKGIGIANGAANSNPVSSD